MVAVTADAIRAARERIPAVFRDSPQFLSEPLAQKLGAPVVVKVETANPIGCFKGRGTWLAVSELMARGEVGERRGLVVASAGNFGQGVAYAGRGMGVPVLVYAATRANSAKVAAMRRLGAEVRLVGEDFDGAREAAAAHATRTGWHLLVDGEDPWISIGAGSIALELTDAVERGDLPTLSQILVPVGNGALIGGIGAWIRAAAPGTRVVGVQAAQAPAMTLSWRARRPIATERADTVADGIAARVPVPEALELMLAGVDEMRLVDEATIIASTIELSEALPLAIEPSAGAAWAAALQQPPGGAVALVLTGGNVAPPDGPPADTTRRGSRAKRQSPGAGSLEDAPSQHRTGLDALLAGGGCSSNAFPDGQAGPQVGAREPDQQTVAGEHRAQLRRDKQSAQQEGGTARHG